MRFKGKDCEERVPVAKVQVSGVQLFGITSKRSFAGIPQFPPPPPPSSRLSHKFCLTTSRQGLFPPNPPHPPVRGTPLAVKFRGPSTQKNESTQKTAPSARPFSGWAMSGSQDGDPRRRLRLLRSVVGIACCAAVLGVVALSYADGDATRRVALNGIDSDMESSMTSIMQVLKRTREAGCVGEQRG